jgi:hypothetical protein
MEGLYTLGGLSIMEGLYTFGLFVSVLFSALFIAGSLILLGELAEVVSRRLYGHRQDDSRRGSQAGDTSAAEAIVAAITGGAIAAQPPGYAAAQGAGIRASMGPRATVGAGAGGAQDTGLMGWRIWHVHHGEDGLLHSVSYDNDETWAEPVAYADVPPSPHNSNGLYCKKTLQAIRDYAGDFARVVYGRIELLGHFVEGEDGYRTEKAMIRELWIPDHYPPELAKAIQERYDLTDDDYHYIGAERYRYLQRRADVVRRRADAKSERALRLYAQRQLAQQLAMQKLALTIPGNMKCPCCQMIYLAKGAWVEACPNNNCPRHLVNHA